VNRALHIAIVVLAALYGAAPPHATATTPASKPNVVLILVDDFGYECVAANGGTSYRTPQLDKLAAGGVRFEHCYVQPLCTPTRVQLMTGIYNVRNYDDFGEIDPSAVTFANLFQQAGYKTGIAGKWQLGRQPELPGKLGFDEHCLWQHTRRPSRYKNPGLEINGKEVDFTGGEYGPDVVNDWALQFVERHREEPFLLYYPMMLTHGPFEPTPDSPNYAAGKGEKSGGKKQPKENRNFAHMVQYADKLMGKLVKRLEELKLRENTLVIVVGDNGTGAGIRSRMGDEVVDGGKGETTKAGMHVPLIVSWPARAPSGKVSTELVDSTDFLPTICAAAGVEVPTELNIDGHSFLPQLIGGPEKPREWYYCWYAPRRELKGEFAANQQLKLYRDGRIFNVQRDPKETTPLKVEELSPDEASTIETLKGVLGKYAGARPAKLKGFKPKKKSAAAKD